MILPRSIYGGGDISEDITVLSWWSNFPVFIRGFVLATTLSERMVPQSFFVFCRVLFSSDVVELLWVCVCEGRASVYFLFR